MATSSITHNFVINTQDGVERFVRAIETSESNYTPSREPKGRELTESHELLDFLKKRKEVHG